MPESQSYPEPKPHPIIYPELATIFPGPGVLGLLWDQSNFSTFSESLHWVFPAYWSERHPQIKKGEYIKRLDLYPIIFDDEIISYQSENAPGMVFSANIPGGVHGCPMGIVLTDQEDRIGLHLQLTGESGHWWKKLFGDAVSVVVVPGRTEENESFLNLLACWISPQ